MADKQAIITDQTETQRYGSGALTKAYLISVH